MDINEDEAAEIADKFKEENTESFKNKQRRRSSIQAPRIIDPIRRASSVSNESLCMQNKNDRFSFCLLLNLKIINYL